MNSNGKWTLLIIDNDHDLVRALAKRLGSMNVDCITATSGVQGLAEFRGADVDIVVSDLNMQGGDGIEFAEAIRLTSDVPIIFITGFRDDFKRRLRHVTNASTLRKPFQSQNLMDLISAALRESIA
ncbi:MAG: response regulator [Planctomycetota bacterium]